MQIANNCKEAQTVDSHHPYPSQSFHNTPPPQNPHPPPILVLHSFRTKRQSVGVKVKNLDSEGYRFRYFMRGKPGSQPSVLMLHGFSLNKDMWLNTIEVFPKGLHLICLDLPGHGGTTRLLGESYTAVAQAKRIHQVGPFLSSDVIHCSLKAGFLDLTSTESKYSLHENMRKIKAPTQIIWGKEDKVFDSSGAEILADAIPNSQVHRLEKCGHFITLERPRTSARLLLEFYNSVCDSAKQKKVA
ncbi:hypothetical protein Chor_011397 [Crotalus horridus]